MVEQRSPKPTVEGSSPSAPANEKQRPLLGVFLFLGLVWLAFLHFLSSFLPFSFPFSVLFLSLLLLPYGLCLAFAGLCCKHLCLRCHPLYLYALCTPCPYSGDSPKAAVASS